MRVMMGNFFCVFLLALLMFGGRSQLTKQETFSGSGSGGLSLPFTINFNVYMAQTAAVKISTTHSHLHLYHSSGSGYCRGGWTGVFTLSFSLSTGNNQNFQLYQYFSISVFTWSISFTLNYKCNAKVSNCYDCTNPSTCTQCLPTYFLYANVCHPTVQNYCMAVRNCPSCTTTQYYLISGICKTCQELLPNCDICASQTICQTCQPQYFFVNSQCRFCSDLIPNCVFCASDTVCQTCPPQFFQVNSFCQSCSDLIPNCDFCASNSVCQTCQLQYFFINSQCQFCSDLIPNCSFCSSGTVCQTCQPQYFYVSQQCQFCSDLIPNCGMCTSDTVCQTCKPQYFYVDQQCQFCQDLIPNCGICTSSTICQACKSPYFLINQKCKICSIPNCDICANNTACQTCEFQYFLLNQQCQFCSDLIPNCAFCVSDTACQICQSQYFLVKQQCKICSDPNCDICANKTACSFCSNGFGYDPFLGKCIKCNDLIKNCRLCSSNSVCNQCYLPYEVDSNQKCQCKSPLYNTSNLCTYDEKCLSATIDSAGTIKCSMCNSVKKYQMNSKYQCVCEQGYQDATTPLCTQICGDGVILISECDDNNSFSGDGCSSECKIQKDFLCQKISSGISKCKLNKNIRLKLDYTDKIISESKAIIYISLDSDNQNVRRFYESGFFNFSLKANRSQTIQILGFQKKSEGQIQIMISYNQTIEDSFIDLGFDFPKENLISQDQHLKFQLKGNNYALIISSFYEKYDQVTTVQFYLIISFYVIVLGFMISDKFIAVEALNTLQMVYFSLLLISSNSWPQAFTTVLPLKYSSGINQLLYEQTNFLNLQDPTFNKYRYLKMCESFLMNNFTNSAILMVLFSISLILFTIKNVLENNIINSENPVIKKNLVKRLRRFRRIFRKFYNVTFHFSYCMIFHVIISLYIETTYMKSITPNEKTLSKLAAMLTSIIIIFTVLDRFKPLFLNELDVVEESFNVGRLESRYKLIYLIYILLNALCMSLFNGKMFFGIPTSTFLGGFGVLYFFFIIFYRPYRYSFFVHGLTLIVNQSIVLITFALISSINFGVKFDETFLLMFCYTLLGFCVIILLLTVLRVVLDYKYGAQKVKQKIQKELKKREKLEEITFVRQPLKKQKGKDQDKDSKQKRNPYTYQNRVKQEEKIDCLNELKAKHFLTEEERDCIYYRFYKEKPLSWVEKYEKKAKYLHLLQKDKEELEKDTYNKELDRKKAEKRANNAELDELRKLKEKMREQRTEKKQQKDKRKQEKRQKRMAITYQ